MMSEQEDWLTKNYAKLITVIHDIGQDGCERGAIDVARLHSERVIEAARHLIDEKKLSVRQTAKLLGVANTTLQRYLTHNGSESDPRVTHEALIRAANAALKLVKTDAVLKRYGTIVIDPPWDMEKIKRDVRLNQVAFDYPTMTEDELCQFSVRDMATEDCHLFCWATQHHLPLALRLLEAWGFKYVFLMTWHKPGGYQPHGLPQFNSEFVVYGRCGAPKFRDTQAFNTCFQGERREHSRKPDVFYDTVRRVTVDGRIDVFSREKREGFEQYGNEAGKFSGQAVSH
jgi:N6-adenosine-specific RNA methylase IME4